MARTRIMDHSEAMSGERKSLSLNDLGAPRARKALQLRHLQLGTRIEWHNPGPDTVLEYLDPRPGTLLE